MVKLKNATVLYADILGFSISAAEPGAARALDQLSDVAHILSTEDSLAKYLQRPVWTARYRLSDSIFLVADQRLSACRAAAEFFFNLAFYNASQEIPVLMRGALAFGEVRKTRPMFPETGRGNLVGPAVVRAVQLERSGPKGPRLLVSPEVAEGLKRDAALNRLLDHQGGISELLWLLPGDIAGAEGLLIGDVASAACRHALSTPPASAAWPHLAAYADLAVRSLLRLKQHNREAARIAIAKASIDVLRDRLIRLFDRAEKNSTQARESLLRLLK